MTEIRIFKLNVDPRTNIIAECEHIEDSIIVQNPMTINIEMQDNLPVMFMKPWLPMELVTDNSVMLSEFDFLCLLNPTSEVIEFYRTTVEKFKKKIEMIEMDNYKDISTEDLIEFAERKITNMLN